MPIRKCLTCAPGQVESGFVEKLKLSGFSQAPLIRPDSGMALGLVSARVIEERCRSGMPLIERDVTDSPIQVQRVPRLEELFGLLEGKTAVLCVFQGPRPKHHGLPGLITFSDLNRHPVRNALFAGLSALEQDLSESIRRRYQSPDKWLSRLTEHDQARFLGFWELSKRKDLDIGPLAAANLTHLLRIVQGDRDFTRDLGYGSRTAFQSETGSIVDLRNRVMHTVRPLLLGQADLTRDRRTLRNILALGERLQTLSSTK